MTIEEQILDVQTKISEAVVDAFNILGSVKKIDSNMLNKYIFSLLQQFKNCPLPVEDHVKIILRHDEKREKVEFFFDSDTREGRKFIDFVTSNIIDREIEYERE